jgi:putative endonuclease
MKEKKYIYHVYIMTNRHHTVLYTGMTGKGLFRIHEHIEKVNPGFTKKYNINKLVFLERFTEVIEAIAREKQIKRWSREKKVWLIEKYNPGGEDLFLKYSGKKSRS